MKKLLFAIAILCFSMSFTVKAQSPSSKASELKLTPRDTLLFEYMDTYRRQLREPQYQLFPTENMWTFLKLNTITGQIWQVQYTVEGPEYRFETILDITPRISEYFDDPICGRFTLYPTKNTYNFILLDQIDGRCWQVQWSLEPSNRGVMRIY